ncbi:polysaccharide biosynthesis tyrosine autokinase [Mycobacterium sp. 3519A]|uniref:polysaccharide biosynthesis tyrosine autokinase n=1 Tax=Mycobacterium sp. 3519A TaxID=2057184 RepID=UPI000C7D63D4|nr:polysaccharide biosynthesis tyrosine autokinase [Mycobacterium sp. 3519A]
MTFQDFMRILRTRWLIVCGIAVLSLAAATAITLLTTPLYEAQTRLFVSTAAGGSASEVYEGNLSSQDRVLSYTKLIMGETLSQRAIDKLRLNMSAEDLQKEIKASSAPGTVLIDVSVRDPSPAQAREIADVLSAEFVAMVKELETAPDGDKPDARVVVEQRASVRPDPVVPNTSRNLLVGLALGVLLGIGFALLRDRLDTAVSDKRVLEEVTGAGLVANIPVDKHRKTDPAISFANDGSPIAEAFREFRTNLQFLEVDNPPRLLVVSSSLPGEGKSTTSINIALALAEAEHNVVLVDGDMRRPKLADYLDLIGSVGFSTVLSGKASLSEVLQKTRFPGLTVLTSGALPPNPSELLGSVTNKKVLSELRSNFDYVIVDSSPLLPVTDAAILAAASDGVLIIGRFAKTTRAQLAQAVENLKKVEARILGAVFTMTPARRNAAYKYSYYSEGPPLTNPPRHQTTRSIRRNQDR